MGTNAKLSDITDKKGLEFKELEAATVPRALDDVDAAVINGNYALEADLKPGQDSLALEKAEGNPYANFLAVKEGNEDDPRVQKLAKLLNSDEVKKFIEDTYKGSIVPPSARSPSPDPLAPLAARAPHTRTRVCGAPPCGPGHARPRPDAACWCLYRVFGMELRMTTTFPSISISTDRLVLRPFDMADVPAYIEMMNDELVTAWTEAPHPYTQVDAERWVRRIAPAERTQGNGIVLAVTEFLTQRLVGSVRLLNTDRRTLATEVRYITAPWARGEGYATEAVLAIAEWLFRDQGFERIELRTPRGTPPPSRSPRSWAASARESCATPA